MTCAGRSVNTTLGEASGTFRWDFRVWIGPRGACKLQAGRSRVVFVLDNYDSFTYNLVQYIGELGAEVEVRRNDQVTVAEVEGMQPERIVISPGRAPRETRVSASI
jgi:hypothetical protein